MICPFVKGRQRVGFRVLKYVFYHSAPAEPAGKWDEIVLEFFLSEAAKSDGPGSGWPGHTLMPQAVFSVIANVSHFHCQ